MQRSGLTIRQNHPYSYRDEQLRHAALHARAQAFPLGFGVLAGKGVTAWQRALASLTIPQPAPPPAWPPSRAGQAGSRHR